MKIKSFVEFINEEAVPMEDIVQQQVQQGLVIKDKKDGQSLLKTIAIYDFDDEMIMSYMSIRKWKVDDYWKVDRSVAEKNFGPPTYDLALMSIYPEYLRPSDMIMPAAQNVWKYYKNKRSDVEKMIINKDDLKYLDEYGENEDKMNLKDPKILDIVNTMFRLKPNKFYNDLIKNGDEYMEKYSITSADIMSKSLKHFWKIYGHE